MTTWKSFRYQHAEQVLPGLADTTQEKISGIFDSIERCLKPAMLADLTPQRIGMYVASLRRDKLAESTIRGHLAHLKAALKWAFHQRLIAEIPHFDMPKRSKRQACMKGRPITGEEFDRMIGKVVKVVPAGHADAWRWLLMGLWTSGLRLGEALSLSWDEFADLSVDLTGRHPMLRIAAEADKGGQERLLPVAPEFGDLLAGVPVDWRRGSVFPVLTPTGGFLKKNSISKIITSIGRAANVLVSAKKYASAHDFRRSFGERWAMRVMPVVLQQLMRHESIETTLRFYVGRNAQAVSDILYSAVNSSVAPAMTCPVLSGQ